MNEVICHGIPDMRPLQNGDLCNVDVTVYHRGFHGNRQTDHLIFLTKLGTYLRIHFILGDLNETLFVGEVDEESKKLTKVTYEALMAAINIGEVIFSFWVLF